MIIHAPDLIAKMLDMPSATLDAMLPLLPGLMGAALVRYTPRAPKA